MGDEGAKNTFGLRIERNSSSASFGKSLCVHMMRPLASHALQWRHHFYVPCRFICKRACARRTVNSRLTRFDVFRACARHTARADLGVSETHAIQRFGDGRAGRRQYLQLSRYLALVRQPKGGRSRAERTRGNEFVHCRSGARGKGDQGKQPQTVWLGCFTSVRRQPETCLLAALGVGRSSRVNGMVSRQEGETHAALTAVKSTPT